MAAPSSSRARGRWRGDQSRDRRRQDPGEHGGSNQGRITIDGVGGSITITGDISAVGRAPGTTGGKIGLLASDSVIVKSGAKVNASGAAGGGTVAVGTTLKRAIGGPSVTGAKMAKSVVIEHGATIAANATAKGNGGRVTVLSSDTTTMNGLIQATGGTAGGNGGFVEVSGASLSLTGAVDVTAPMGLLGTILLDPTNLTVVVPAAISMAPPASPMAARFCPRSILAARYGFHHGAVGQHPVAGDEDADHQFIADRHGIADLRGRRDNHRRHRHHRQRAGRCDFRHRGAGPASATLPAAQANPLISVLGTVTSTGGSVSLLSGAGGSVSIGAAGSVAVPTAAKLATVQTDTLTIGAGGAISGSIVEIAPASSIAVTLAARAV